MRAVMHGFGNLGKCPRSGEMVIYSFNGNLKPFWLLYQHCKLVRLYYVPQSYSSLEIQDCSCKIYEMFLIQPLLYAECNCLGEYLKHARWILRYLWRASWNSGELKAIKQNLQHFVKDANKVITW